MKITASKLEKYLLTPNNFDGVLIYGGDYDKVVRYTDRIIKQLTLKGQFSIYKKDFNVVNKDPSMLLEEVITLSMLGEKKIVHLVSAGESLSVGFKEVLSQVIGKEFIIISGNDLSIKSSLRSYFEKSQDLAVVACYKNDNENLQEAIYNYFQDQNILCSEEVVQYLYNFFRHDSSSLYSELNKILLYIGAEKKINLQDIKDYSFLDVQPSLDNLCFSIADKNSRQFIKLSNLLFREKFTTIALIRIISRYFLRLEEAMRLIKSGMKEDLALKSINPPIFFKHLPTFKRHIHGISDSKIHMMLKKMWELELLCKKTDINQELIFKHFIMLMIN